MGRRQRGVIPPILIPPSARRSRPLSHDRSAPFVACRAEAASSCLSSSVELLPGEELYVERVLLNLQHKLDAPGMYSPSR